MKTFESLFAELSEKAQTRPEGSLTVDELDKGTHFIGKKIIEEAGRRIRGCGPHRRGNEPAALPRPGHDDQARPDA